MTKRTKSKKTELPKRGRPAQGDSDKIKGHLLEAATSLFAKKGFNGTSVKDIADAARANISLVSYHFGGKEGLYRACLERLGTNRLAATERLLQPAKTIDEMKLRLEMFIDDLLIWFDEEPEVCAIVQREVDLGFPVALDVFENTFLKVFTTLVAFIRAGQTKSYLRADVDPHISASLLFGGLTSAVQKDEIAKRVFGFSLEDAGYRKKFKTQVCRLFFEGVKK